jgi:RHS repeat-associated protein
MTVITLVAIAVIGAIVALMWPTITNTIKGLWTGGNSDTCTSYDAYGNCTVSNETTDQQLAKVNPIRYRGYYYDVETQLFYCNSRYYSPELCRWISPDSIEYLDPESINGLNLYCYCYNNPIMYVDDMGNLPVPVDVITSIIGYSADLYSFCLKMSLKSMPELSMAVAKKMARKAGHIQSARSYIRARHSNIVKTQNLSKGAKNFSKHFGRAVLVADILWSAGENYVSGDPNWVSDSVVDAVVSVGIYALGCIPYVGWALAIGATILTEVFDDEIEELKDLFAEEWNDFWSFSWAN